MNSFIENAVNTSHQSGQIDGYEGKEVANSSSYYGNVVTAILKKDRQALAKQLLMGI